MCSSLGYFLTHRNFCVYFFDELHQLLLIYERISIGYLVGFNGSFYPNTYQKASEYP